MNKWVRRKSVCCLWLCTQAKNLRTQFVECGKHLLRILGVYTGMVIHEKSCAQGTTEYAESRKEMTTNSLNGTHVVMNIHSPKVKRAGFKMCNSLNDLESQLKFCTCTCIYMCRCSIHVCRGTLIYICRNAMACSIHLHVSQVLQLVSGSRFCRDTLWLYTCTCICVCWSCTLFPLPCLLSCSTSLCVVVCDHCMYRFVCSLFLYHYFSKPRS